MPTMPGDRSCRPPHGPPSPLLHVIGAGPWQLPTIRRARAMGLRVLVTDGYADRPGYAEADLHAVADLADPEATLAAARRHRVDGVLCDTTDTGVRAAAHVAAALGLPGAGLAAARRCTDKAEMTECLRAAGLRVPASQRLRTADGLAEAVRAVGGLPVVVKPVDAQSGRGVSVVRHGSALSAALASALCCSRSGQAIVQRFVEGVEVIVDSLVVGARVTRLGIARKTPFEDNPTVSKRITYDAADPRLPMPAAALEEVNAATLVALGIRQGLVHAEYLVDGDGPQPVDVAVRGGGVMIYPRVLDHVSGIDTTSAAISLALGRPVEAAVAARPRGASIEFLRAAPGCIDAIEGAEAARAQPGVAAVHLFHGPGQRLGALRDKEDRVGFVLALADDGEQADAQARRAAAMIRVRLTPDPQEPAP